MSAAPNPLPHLRAKHVVCVSWIASLALTRGLLLQQEGWEVTSIIGPEYTEKLGDLNQATDLLVLAHSVPMQEKRHILQLFRSKSGAPVLSLLLPHHTKLPEADFGVEAMSAADFMRIVKEILGV